MNGFHTLISHIHGIPVSVIIAAIGLFATGRLGPFGLSNYVMEDEYDEKNSYSNIAFRIVTPAIWCALLTVIAGTMGMKSGSDLLSGCTLSTLLYWILLAFLKISKKTLLSATAFLIESIASCCIATLLDSFVIVNLLEGNFDVLDDSSIAFQAELAIFMVVVQVVAHLTARKKGDELQNDGPSRSEKCRIDVSEKKMYEYERRFGHLLPERYTADPLLRALFFSIMTIEDSSRPSYLRSIERLAFRFGMAKTTGIMQQQSPGTYPLTDEESVKLAVGYVEHMWDRFLIRFAKCSGGSGNYSDPVLISASEWYTYCYDALSQEIKANFGLLYGDYCGTRNHRVSSVFCDVLRFYEGCKYGMMPDEVVVPYKLLFPESKLFAGPVFWSDDHTLLRADLNEKINTDAVYAFSMEGASSSFKRASDLCELLSGFGSVLCVSYVKGAYSTVFALADTVEEIKGDVESRGWSIRPAFAALNS